MKNRKNILEKQNSLQPCAYDSVQISEPYLVNAAEKTEKYLLSLDADRLLAGFEETAGRTPDAERYPGWESTEIQGHTIGHYLTALAQAYVGTGNRAFADRIEKVCRRLKECQRVDGFLFASGEEIFDRLEKRRPAWVPWYTFHKILAGLTAVYELTGNKDAYDTAVGMGNWASKRALGWTEEMRRDVLSVEYGGMNDALYELYKITGRTEYMEAAHRFDEEKLFEALHENRDILNNLHANTTIPKILGSMNRYQITGEDYYFEAARNFWHIVVEHHTYITGGNSEWEHFGETDILDGERTACNCETCNVYNMLKLTKLLYMYTGDKSYMDFYERAWTNAILGSQNPETGMTMYFQPMETGLFKVYQDPYSDFWCCTGTGMENFTKLQDALYFRKDDSVYITRYISSSFRIPEWGMEIRMQVHFPETDRIAMQINAEEQTEKTFFFRIPQWTHGQVKAAIDGKAAEASVRNGYLAVPVNGSMTVELQFFPTVEAHPLPDNRHAAAFTYGPAVLCASLAEEELDVTLTGVQVKVPTRKMFIKDYLVLEDDTPEEWLEHLPEHLVREEGKLSFALTGTDEDERLRFIPYYSKYKGRYGIYWTLYQKGSDALLRRGRDQEQQKRIEDIAVDIIPVGNDQYELAHRIQGEGTEASREHGYNYRWINGRGYFQYEMAVDPKGSGLVVTYGSMDEGSEFDILVDGRLLVHEKLTDIPHELYRKYYELTEEMLEGKTKVTVTFRTLSEKSRCRIFQTLYVCGIDKK